MSSSFFVRGAPLRIITDAPTIISKASKMAWSTRLSTMLRRDKTPDSVNMLLLDSMVVTKAATSIGRDKFDLQIVNSRFREIEDAQNALVIHAVVGCQEEHALLRRTAAKDRSDTRGQFSGSNFLISQHHATVRRKGITCGRRGNAATRRDRKSTRLNSSHDQISYAV